MFRKNLFKLPLLAFVLIPHLALSANNVPSKTQAPLSSKQPIRRFLFKIKAKKAIITNLKSGPILIMDTPDKKSAYAYFSKSTTPIKKPGATPVMQIGFVQTDALLYVWEMWSRRYNQSLMTMFSLPQTGRMFSLRPIGMNSKKQWVFSIGSIRKRQGSSHFLSQVTRIAPGVYDNPQLVSYLLPIDLSRLPISHCVPRETEKSCRKKPLQIAHKNKPAK